ncbi:KpsF/GutQ family sugar-phosphate isomerase [Pseudoalteromonas carrageenovora]|uniref:KpsF/GutQ family sugar-phosphate isomerase n=1 Tax=Pseudoalteromonas carrageenovora TaxID=227 RepID=UPI0026E1EDE2|nr:KpsF/GutQ family sugar-phosphate isomerase [Pseudoalteromonas carrageenovora]MDO6635776.1 KpsF/GutQ family sugar-phosphate isomerase [Pseudoalteromonas carrageenovora]MDO6647769.1 KpsF/GutQ family sugar-phosphate isomerase [Pseudoalteromonas carrageenovora]
MNNLSIAKRVITTEISALQALAQQLDKQFDTAVNSILSTKGRTIICGMGKSGIIGKKIAASLASTGTPSFFMHPGEAFHGDLGMVTTSDVFIAISNSGETEEVLRLLPFLKDNKNIIIAMTGAPLSTLATNSDCHLNISVPEEACPLQLAPTSSTTAALVMGDALTVALMERKSFKPENFARFHPGGNLGRRLLNNVSDEMVVDNLPFVNVSDTLYNVIDTISKGRLGLAIINEKGKCGIITDGDIRRILKNDGKDAFHLTANDIASFKPHFISSKKNIQCAIQIMENNSITSLLVKDGEQVIGVLKK